MKFNITLTNISSTNELPINYQYPLSAAIYKIIDKGDKQYAQFLHEKGYGQGHQKFKLFTFSQLSVPFKIVGDRLKLNSNEASFTVSFHLPQAMESFIKGLFQSEEITIADKQSKVNFKVKSVESLPNPLANYKDNEIINKQLQVHSPIVAGIKNDKGNFDFLSPEDPRFIDSLIYNWRSKIATVFDQETSASALLMLAVIPMKQAPKSRLITIKADTPEQTKIKGWMNFGLQITGEKRFIELLMNSGAGLYNSMGMGFVGGSY